MRSLIIANSTVCSTACIGKRQLKTYLSLLIILKNYLTAAYPTVDELPPISGNGKYIFWRFSQIYNVPTSFNLRHMGELSVYLFLLNVVSIVLAFSEIIVKPNWMRWTTLFEEIIFYIWLKMFECNEYIYLKPQRISKCRRCSISQHLGGDVVVVLTWYWGVFGHCSDNIM